MGADRHWSAIFIDAGEARGIAFYNSASGPLSEDWSAEPCQGVADFPVGDRAGRYDRQTSTRRMSEDDTQELRDWLAVAPSCFEKEAVMGYSDSGLQVVFQAAGGGPVSFVAPTMPGADSERDRLARALARWVEKFDVQ